MIDEQIVWLIEIIADIEIRPSIGVHIGYGNTESETQHIGRDAGRFAHIREAAAIISVELTGEKRIVFLPESGIV